ncbi:MAG: ABC transporter substrate-binding protein [Actinomycetota bacterium]|nr:ABC transporter substrate-binding protein [Actinomycetota bacterium]
MKKFKKIMAYFVFITIICMNILLCSCDYSKIELLASIDDENVTGSGEEIQEESRIIYSKEFFLAQKEEQLNKNPLGDLNIRKAVFYAIDRERIVEELYGKYNEVINSLFAQGSFYSSQSWSQYDYNPDKAVELLNRAGYGVDNPLYVTIGSISNSETKDMIEEFIKEDLGKIGIKIWVFNKPSEEWYGDCVGNGEYEMGLWSVYNFNGSSLNYSFNSVKIPPMLTEDNKNCENFYWYGNQEVDLILEDLESEDNIEERKKLFGNLQDLVADDAVVLPLYSRIYAIVFNNEKIEELDVSVKNNEFFFDLESWVLNDDWHHADSEDNEIVVGCRDEDYDLYNLLGGDFISDLMIKGLWRLNEIGEYENFLVSAESYQGNRITSVYNKKINVVLKDEIFWQNGEPITSEDIKYSYDVILENEGIIDNYEDYLKIEDIEIINEKEFNILLKEYISDYRKLFGFIMPAGFLEEKDITSISVNDIVSNGPYKLGKYDKDSYLLLEKNEYYFEEISGIHDIRIVFDTDINNLIGMLEDKEVDILSVPFDLTLVSRLDEGKDFGLLIKPGNMIEQLALCLKPKEE